jgi:hypothetical protein
MWYTVFRFLANIAIFFVRLFEKFLDLNNKWSMLILLVFTSIFMEANYSFFGENRLDFFLSVIAVWFSLWILLVTEFILEKPLPIYYYYVYMFFCLIWYLFCSHFHCDLMPFLYFVFWFYFYFVTLIYCSFMFSLIIFLTQHFRIIQRFFRKIFRILTFLFKFVIKTLIFFSFVIYICLYFILYFCLYLYKLFLGR